MPAQSLGGLHDSNRHDLFDVLHVKSRLWWTLKLGGGASAQIQALRVLGMNCHIRQSASNPNATRFGNSSGAKGGAP